MTTVTAGLANVRGLLIDLDGVVYTGREPTPGAVDFLAEARRRGVPFLLATNNSTATNQQFAERLARMGVAVAPEEILTSSQAAAAVVWDRSQTLGLGRPARVLAVGEDGIREALKSHGLELVEDGEAEWVVAGLDRQFDYARLSAATRAILAGARFVATNTDALLPVEGGAMLPGAGSIVGAIRGATGVEPLVIGKPERAIFEQGIERLGRLAPREVLMIGDRIDTDVVGAQRAGLRTALVLTGVSSPEQAAALQPPADAVVANLPALAALLGWGELGSAMR